MGSILKEEFVMKIKRLLIFLSCICCISVPMQSNAAETEIGETDKVIAEEISPYAAGLISGYSLGCSAGTKTIKITARTVGYEEMSKIGFTNIKIQRSTNLVNWTTEKTISDKIAENATTHTLDKYAVSVEGGYYYRITLTHYAKEQTWFFPDEQSVTNTSSYVWIA